MGFRVSGLGIGLILGGDNMAVFMTGSFQAASGAAAIGSEGACQFGGRCWWQDA